MPVFWTSPALRIALALCGLTQRYPWTIHVNISCVVEIVRKDVQCYVGNDLGDLAIIEVGRLQRLYGFFADSSLCTNDLASKMQRSGLTRIRALGPPAIGNFGFIKADQLANSAVRRNAVLAPVGFADDQSNLLPQSWRQDST